MKPFDSLDSFIRGFNRGGAVPVELTNREISESYPDVNVDAFAQGMLDALIGDRWRLDLAVSRKPLLF